MGFRTCEKGTQVVQVAVAIWAGTQTQHIIGKGLSSFHAATSSVCKRGCFLVQPCSHPILLQPLQVGTGVTEGRERAQGL